MGCECKKDVGKIPGKRNSGTKLPQTVNATATARVMSMNATVVAFTAELEAIPYVHTCSVQR